MTSTPSLSKRSRRPVSDSDEDFTSREESSIRTTPESEKAVFVDVPIASTSRLVEEKRVKVGALTGLCLCHMLRSVLTLVPLSRPNVVHL